MNHIVREHPLYGSCLFIDNGVIEAGIPLNFGLRIGHFSFVGEKNVFFEQPKDTTVFTTEEGWRIRGGHRMWLAPESPKDYFPDNDPISYQINGDTLILTQKEDPWLQVIKQFLIALDGSCMKVTHQVTNTADTARRCSLWGISVMAPGGTEYINFERRDGGYDPWHHISMWDYTSLGDPRVQYTRDQIKITQMPTVDAKYKIGVGHPCGPVRYENGNTVFVKHFSIDPQGEYPDGGVSFETFCSQYMVEIESLSPLLTIEPTKSQSYTEVLELLRKS